MDEAWVVETWSLKGGISADMTAVETEAADGTRRRHVVRKSRTAAMEFGLLTFLFARGFPVPEPLGLEGDALLLEYIEGEARFEQSAAADSPGVYARLLRDIHEIDGSLAEFAALDRAVDTVSNALARQRAVFDDALREREIRDVLRAHWPPDPVAVSLLHGDLWPGNVLWRDGEVVAVIDWEDAWTGDPLADVGTTRLDMLWKLRDRMVSTCGTTPRRRNAPP